MFNILLRDKHVIFHRFYFHNILFTLITNKLLMREFRPWPIGYYEKCQKRIIFPM